MAILYGGVPLLSVRDREEPDFAAAARKLARRVGLDVSGANELVWPSGAGRVGGMIGMIEQSRLATLLEPWNDWRSGASTPATLPSIQFHGVPAMKAALVEVEPLTDAADGLHLVALLDARQLLQESTFATSTSLTSGDWSTAMTSVVESFGFSAPTIFEIEDRLSPELEDPRVQALSVGEWLDAAAWSVGGAWRLRPDGSLQLQSVDEADDVEGANRELPLGLVRGTFDAAPSRPLSAIRMGVGEAYGAVRWPRGEAILAADSVPAEGTGRTWRPTTTALWERAPVDGSQFNGPELQALAEALLSDAIAWTSRPYRVELAGFVDWEPSARDRMVRWIDRGRDKCRTLVEGLSPADLPRLLVHRSSVAPREASLTESVSQGSASAGNFVAVTLLETTGRPERDVIAYYPTYPPGYGVGPGESVWVDYDRSNRTWIVVPWTTAP